MTDINEMRRLVQDANQEMWVFWHGIVATDVDSDGAVVVAERPTPSGGKYQARVDARLKFIAAANPAAISELIDRLEAAERERDWHAERYEDAMNECAALRAKIARMERQEPVGEIRRANSTGNYINPVVWVPMAVGAKLYAGPGAKGEEK